LKANNNLLLESGTNCSICINICSDNESNEVCNIISAFVCGEKKAEIGIRTDARSDGDALAWMCSSISNNISSRDNNISGTFRNAICSQFNHIIAAVTGIGFAENFIHATSSVRGRNCIVASTNNYLCASCCNEIQSGTHCWVFCCDGNLYKDGVCVL